MMMTKTLCSTGLRWLWLAALVLILDVISKQWVMSRFTLHETLPMIPSVNLTYAQNPGAAFSFLADKSGWQRWFFAGIAVVITLTLLVFMYRSSARNHLTNCAYALIIGGALGNLFDRIMYAVVIDFIDFYVNDWHWPTFNLADTAICIGAALIAMEGFIHPETATKKK